MRLCNFNLRYGQKIILRNTNVTFSPGRINHLLGRNGAGKSSLAKALAGIIPFEGKIEDCDSSVTVIGSYSRIPEDLRVSDLLSVIQGRNNGDMLSKLYQGLFISSITESTRIGKLSDGQRQKLKLLYFLSSNPKIIILDEITSALDKASSQEVCLFLNEYLNRPGITSINITHDISDLDRMVGDYFLLEEGTILPIQDKKTLINRYLGVS